MKTIVHVIDSLAVGGAEVLLTNTIPLLKDYHNIVCFLHQPDNLKDRFGDCPVHYLGFEKKADIVKSVRKLRSIIKESHASILHSQLLWSSWIARLACPSDVQLIFSIQNILSRDAFQINRLSLVFERFTYSKRQIAIACSKVALDDYDKYVGLKGPHFILYNYIDDVFFEKKYVPRAQLNGTFRLLAMGNLRRQKNYQKILEAFTHLRDYEIYLDIYGVGELENELAAFIEKHNIKVSLKGRAENRIDLYTQYDAFIMCSLFEGFSLALVEAMALGMPILVSNIEVLREAVEDRGLYFDPHEAKAMANVILHAFANWDQFRELSMGNSEFIKQKTSREQYLKQLLHIYSTC
jgi:glycosyltransferase involved in cell wall biosynthesis